MNIKQESGDMSLGSSDDELDDFDELVTKVRLDDIMRNVCTSRSTWVDLREQYSPKQSAFAPLNFITSTWVTFTKAEITGLAKDIAADKAYSQAATMTAYGIELLRVALGSPQVDRRRIRQVGNMLVTICATLSDTHNRHRVDVSKMLGDKVDAYRLSQHVGEKIESEHANSLEPIGQSGTSKACRQGRRVSGSVVREHGHPYFCDTWHHETLRQQNSQLRDLDTVREVNSTESAPFYVQLPSIDDGQRAGDIVEDAPVATTLTSLLDDADSTSGESVDVIDSMSGADSDSDSTSDETPDNPNSPSIANSTVAIAVVAAQVSRQVVLPMELSRRNIIREALSRQGFSESATIAYFNQYRKRSIWRNDSLWRCWTWWCEAKGIDPCIRSNVDLKTCVSEIAGAEGWKKVRSQVNLVWSIVEGHLAPRETRA